MAVKTKGNQVNRGPRLRWYLCIPGNMMIRARQQRRSSIAVKKTAMIRMERRLEQVREQPTDHPHARRKKHLPDLNRPVNQLAVQQPANSPYTYANQRMLLCIRHPLIPFYLTATTAQLQLNWLSPFP
jgi:hypothetical protein